MREAEFADRLPRYDGLVVDEAQDHDTAFAAGIGSRRGRRRSGKLRLVDDLFRPPPRGGAVSDGAVYDGAQRPPFRGSGGFEIQRLATSLSQPAFARLPHALRYTRRSSSFSAPCAPRARRD